MGYHYSFCEEVEMLKGLITDAIAHLRECILLNVSLVMAIAAGVAYLRCAGSKADRNVIKLFIYGVIVTALLLFPVSSSVLRIVIGTYYDAPDMWIVMPLIPFGAAMCAALSGELANRLKAEKKVTVVLGCVLFAAAVLLCGSMGIPREQSSGRPENAGELEQQLSIMILEKKLLGGGEQIVMAPDDIMAYLHTHSGNAVTLYGRDMWDGRLTKNRYGSYDQSLITLHDDMTAIMNGETDIAPEVCRRAFDLGATVVIMPGSCDYTKIKEAGFEVVMFGGVTMEGDCIPETSGCGYLIISE